MRIDVLDTDGESIVDHDIANLARVLEEKAFSPRLDESASPLRVGRLLGCGLHLQVHDEAVPR